MLNDGGLVVFERGKFLAFGDDHVYSWTQLASNAMRDSGSNPDSITIEAFDGELDSWLDSEIVIASTDFDDGQAEVFTVTSVGDGNNPTVALSGDLAYDHYALEYYPSGQTGAEWLVEEKAEVGLLTRNVVIRAQSGTWNSGTEDYDWADGTGEHGHVLVTKDSDGYQPIGRFSWARFKNLGVEGKVGRYPLHLHLIGECDFSSTGTMVKNCSFTNCFNKFLAVHGTQEIEVIGNVGYDTIGNGFYLEDEDTTEIRLQNNLGLGVKALDLETYTVGDHDLEPAVFWYVSPLNEISGNHAAGSSDYGFWYHPEGSSLDDEIDGTTSYFKNNVGHSTRQVGFYQEKVATNASPARAEPWYEEEAEEQDQIYQLENCTFYKNRRYGLWLRSYGRVFLNNIRVADNRSGFYLASDGFQKVDDFGPGGSWRTLSYITLRDSLAIGETSNLGFEDTSRPQEDEANRSMPQVVPFVDWTGRPHEIPWAALSGIELYDGLVELDGMRFAEFKDRVDLDYPDGGGVDEATRIGAGITQVAYDSQYMIDPRNRSRGLEFDDAGTPSTVSHRVYFRYPDTAMGANMIKNTLLFDEDGTATASGGLGAGYLYPAGEPLHSDGFSPSEVNGGLDGTLFLPDGGADFASLVIEPLTGGSNIEWIEVTHQYNVPDPGDPQYVHFASGELRFPLAVATERWYTLEFYEDDQQTVVRPSSIDLELRFAEQAGSWVIIAVPWGSTEPNTITVNGSTVSAEEVDFESLEDSNVNAFWWESTNEFIIVKVFATLASGDVLSTGTQNLCHIEQ